MKNKYKIILIICVIIGICSILVGSIAYYRIVVEGSIKGSTGNAVFVLKDENSNVWNNKEINLGKVNPGDSGEFTVTMDASGSTVDMYVTLEIERNTLPTNLKFYTTSDHKSELHKYYSFLETTNQTETLTIYWYWNPYIDDIEDSKFINVSNLEANIRVSAVQISEYAMMKNGASYVPSTRTYNGTEFWNDDYRPYIRMINFSNDLSNLPETCNDANLCFDVSNGPSQIRKVYAYLVDSGLTTGTNTYDDNGSEILSPLYNLYIVSEAPIFAPADCSFMLSNFNNLEVLNFNNNFNTSLTTSMKAMFAPVRLGNNNPSSNYTKSRIMLLSNDEYEHIDFNSEFSNEIVELDLSSFNTSKVTNMNGMFAGYSSLTSLDLSNFNTSNVTDMNSMFYECSSLTRLDLNNFNTSNVTIMYQMFYGCLSLTSLDLGGFNTSNVTDMNSMFYECSSLTKLDLNNFNTSNVTNMYQMFYGCLSLTSLDLGGFNTSKTTYMEFMFCDCSSLTSLDLSSFNTSNVTSMNYMFYRCSSLTSLDLSNFNTSNVTNMDSMFDGCSSLTSLDLSSFNTSNVTNMVSMFLNCRSLISLDLSGFNTSNVTKFGDDHYGGMFHNCSKLTTTINIMNANVTNYGYMFLGAATDPNAKITVNYIADASTLVDNMIATKSSNSNVIKGKQL